MVDTVSNAFPSMVDTVSNVFPSLVDTVLNAFPSLVDTVLKTFRQWPTLFRMLFRLWSTIFSVNDRYCFECYQSADDDPFSGLANTTKKEKRRSVSLCQKCLTFLALIKKMSVYLIINFHLKF